MPSGTPPVSGHPKVVLISIISIGLWDCRFLGLTLFSSPSTVHGKFLVQWALLL